MSIMRKPKRRSALAGLMLAAAVLEENPDIGDDALVEALSSNLCRCTGYVNILKAVRAAADEMRAAR